MKWKKEAFDRNLLLLSASCSKESINERILLLFEDHLKKHEIIFDVVHLREYSGIPMLLEKENVPEEIHKIYKKIVGCKHLIIFCPEHNGYFSAFFKNILDWMSLIKVEFLKGIKVVMVSVSNTQKEIRIMEDGAKKTMKIFTDQPIEFINFNRYEEYDDEKIIDLFKKIHNLFT